MGRYVALLRGINVGGKNLIRMTELKACFEAQGLRDVVTYIQSGNVLFSTPDAKASELTRRIETALSKTFDYEARVVVRSRAQMHEIVARAPKGFGAEPAKYRYDVIFVKEPLTAAKAIEGVPTREGVDRAHVGPGVLYFSRLISKATQSRLAKVVSMPIYQHLTIRNWNTTTKLVALVSAEAASPAKSAGAPKRRTATRSSSTARTD
jgi:uncharacterized protein (DUF1697 family)